MRTSGYYWGGRHPRSAEAEQVHHMLALGIDSSLYWRQQLNTQRLPLGFLSCETLLIAQVVATRVSLAK